MNVHFCVNFLGCSCYNYHAGQSLSCYKSTIVDYVPCAPNIQCLSTQKMGKGIITTSGRVCSNKKSKYKFLIILTVSRYHIHYFFHIIAVTWWRHLHFCYRQLSLAAFATSHKCFRQSTPFRDFYYVLEMRDQRPRVKFPIDTLQAWSNMSTMIQTKVGAMICRKSALLFRLLLFVNTFATFINLHPLWQPRTCYRKKKNTKHCHSDYRKIDF